jgi:hypothetical protein
LPLTDINEITAEGYPFRFSSVVRVLLRLSYHPFGISGCRDAIQLRRTEPIGKMLAMRISYCLQPQLRMSVRPRANKETDQSVQIMKLHSFPPLCPCIAGAPLVVTVSPLKSPAKGCCAAGIQEQFKRANSPMSDLPQKFVFRKMETWQFRRARSVSKPFALALRRVCEANRAIRACYLLDTRKQEGSDLKLTIALSLDDEANQMDNAVMHLQEMLRKFPEIARNSAIMSAERFARDYAGAEFYVRSATTANTVRIPIQKTLAYKYTAIDLQLRDRSIVENFAVDRNGFILGKILGGRDRIDESPLPFQQEDIQAYRYRAGLAARLGIARWHNLVLTA